MFNSCGGHVSLLEAGVAFEFPWLSARPEFCLVLFESLLATLQSGSGLFE